MIKKDKILESFKEDPKLAELLKNTSLDVRQISYSDQSDEKFVEALKMLIASKAQENTDQKILKDINQVIVS